MGSKPPAPFMKSFISSLTECSPWTQFMSQATAMPTMTDQSTDVEPEPSIRLPSPVI